MTISKMPRPAWVGETLNSAERKLLRDCLLAAAGVGLIMLTTCNMAQSAPVTCDQRGCSDWQGAPAHKQRRISQSIDAHGNGVVVGHRPPGCPRAYCGCGTSLYLFGKIIPELNLAANWMRKFPVSSAAPGMVAARRGHVMVLLSHIEGNDWLTWDPNSGGGLTRQHIRSIKGYRVVNPHGSYAER